MCTDCRTECQLLTCENVKSSQLTGDRGSTISKIIELENKTEIEIEHVHVKMKTVEEDIITNKGVTMVLECDSKVKEERIKCVRERLCDDTLCIGNTTLQCGN